MGLRCKDLVMLKPTLCHLGGGKARTFQFGCVPSPIGKCVACPATMLHWAQKNPADLARKEHATTWAASPHATTEPVNDLATVSRASWVVC